MLGHTAVTATRRWKLGSQSSQEEGGRSSADGAALAREVGAADICRTLSSRRISVQMDDAGAVDNNGFLDDVADGGDHVSFPALGTAESMLQDAIAIDCEMVKTESQNSALARVCAVSWDEEVLMDEYVAPGAPVTDYLTVRHKTHTHRTGFLCSGSASSPPRSTRSLTGLATSIHTLATAAIFRHS